MHKIGFNRHPLLMTLKMFWRIQKAINSIQVFILLLLCFYYLLMNSSYLIFFHTLFFFSEITTESQRQIQFLSSE